MTTLCASKNVNDKMLRGIDVAKTAEFNCDSYLYLNSIFKRFKSELRKNSKFLEFLECSQISRLFDEFLKKSGKYNNSKNIEKCGIKGGDILIIKCPSIFASYHFIVVAVNLEKTGVSIIQSYGNFLKFHKIDMSFEEFMDLLTTIETFKTEKKSFDEAYPEMIEVESKLYGVDDKKYIAHLEARSVHEENSRGKNEGSEANEANEVNVSNENNESESEENSYIERAGLLDIPPFIYENLEYQYGINQITLEINAYRVKSEFKSDLCKESVKVGTKKSRRKIKSCRKSILKRKGSGKGKSRSVKKSKSTKTRSKSRKTK